YFRAVAEDLGHLPPGPPRVHQTPHRTEWKLIPDVIHDARSRAFGQEAMSVPPNAIRAAQLHIDELMRRFPALDQGRPLKRNTVELQLIVDARTGCQPNRSWRQNMEIKLARSDGFEI